MVELKWSRFRRWWPCFLGPEDKDLDSTVDRRSAIHEFAASEVGQKQNSRSTSTSSSVQGGYNESTSQHEEYRRQQPRRGAGAEPFTMAELARATSNFSPHNKIGQGGFGMVYRGRLKDGRVVAIKRGKKDTYEQRLSVEFRTEVEMLSQVLSPCPSLSLSLF